MVNKKPELISPAGNWSALNSALNAGCDAVYFGVKDINMRKPAGNFDILEINKLTDLVHKKGKKAYLALNVIVYNDELEKVRRIMEAAKKARVDAVILWDMAVLSIANELGLRIHISTQASISNWESLKFYADLGASRVVLARECSLVEIRNIKEKIIKSGIPCEIETFIHGAMCVSISGRCFLSQHSFFKSANRGECLQPCRREFTIIDKNNDTENDCEYVLGEGYVLSPKDLCTIRFIDKLIEAGIDSFKIEGRMRPPEYVSLVTGAYRDAIESYYQGTLTDEKKNAMSDRLLNESFNRGFEDGFFFQNPGGLGGKTESGYEKTYIGEVLKYYKRINVAEIILTCKGLEAGEKILISGKRTPAQFTEVSEMQIEHKPVFFVKKGEKVGIKLPFDVRPGDKVFLWRERI